MKFKLKLAVCSMFLCLGVFSCKKEESASKTYMVVSGNVKNPKNNSIFVSRNAILDTLKITSQGTFRDTLTIAPGMYYFTNGDYKNTWAMYLQHGDDITMAIDFEDFEDGVTFSGRGSNTNRYLLKKQQTLARLRQAGREDSKLDENAYKNAKLKNRQVLDSLLEDSKNELPDEFFKLEKESNYYQYLSDLTYYENVHKYQMKRPDFKVSDSFLSELEQVDFNDFEAYKHSSSYQNLLRNHYREKVMQTVETDSIEPEFAYLKVIGKIKNEELKNLLLYTEAKNTITYTKDLEGYYEAFLAASTNEDNNIDIKSIYNDLKKLSKGELSPKFVNYESFDGKAVSLDEFKGKYVYIDVWATWCMPCLKQVPYLKEVEKNFHDKNIEFVGISVDKLSDHDKWKDMVKSSELSGIQLFADKSFDSDFIKNYKIQAIPRFILVDTEGRIVDANAPKPSESELTHLFKSLGI